MIGEYTTLKRFKDYITEKTSKKEFEEALKNPNIFCGCEFEFILNDNNSNTDYRQSYDEDIEPLLWKVNTEIIEAQDRIDDYYRTIGSAYEEINSFHDELASIKDDAAILVSDTTTDNTEELNDLGDKARFLLNKIKDLEDKLDNGWFIEELNPIPNTKTLPNYFELIKILSYYNDFNTHNMEKEDVFNNECLEWFEYEEIPDIGSFLQMDIRNYFYSMEQEVDSSLIDGLNFPYDVSKKDWGVIPDSSLTEGGIEIVTPKMVISQLIDTIENVFKWIDKNGSTDSSCGFHVHMSLQINDLDTLKLILFAEEGIVYKHFANRIGNNYAKSIRDSHISVMEPLTVSDVIELSQGTTIEKNFDTGKYLGINLVDLRNNHIEFRYMGGADYHKKFKEVREVIANYAHWLSIACDPEYKKKEYITKVSRLANYFNYIYMDKIVKKFYRMVKDEYTSNATTDKEKASIKRISDIIAKPYVNQLKSITKKPEGDINLMNTSAIRDGSSRLFDKFKKKMDELEK